MLRTTRFADRLHSLAGAVSPDALRVLAWLVLVLPTGAVYARVRSSHALVALLEAAVCVGLFFGLRSLAKRRERAAGAG